MASYAQAYCCGEGLEKVRPLEPGDPRPSGISMGLDYGLTHSCYDPDLQGRSCGRCDSCRLRLKGFVEAGAEDPASYQ